MLSKALASHLVQTGFFCGTVLDFGWQEDPRRGSWVSKKEKLAITAAALLWLPWY